MKLKKFLISSLIASAIFAVVVTNRASAQKDTEFSQDIVPSEIVASLPKGYFLENMAVGTDRAFYITNYVGKEILRYHPEDGLSHFAELDAHPIGINFDSDGSAYITAHQVSLFSGKDFQKSNVIYRMNSSGQAELWQTVEDAGFLNGVLSLSPGELAIADSITGVIWKIDVDAKTVEPWIQNELLEPISQSDGIPAANGLKIFDGYLYISNSARKLLMRMPISESVDVGQLEKVYENVVMDDFAFSKNGTIYSSTHGDNVFRIQPNGDKQIIADIEQGVLGSTAVAFGETSADSEKLYVIGDGGLFAGGELQPATIVRLDVNEKGYSGR